MVQSQRLYPYVGQIVLYKVDPEFDPPELLHNQVEVLPAIVVRPWSGDCVNLKIFTDGEVDVWKTSVLFGDEPGQWQ